jgi:hypothetical protein
MCYKSGGLLPEFGFQVTKDNYEIKENYVCVCSGWVPKGGTNISY